MKQLRILTGRHAGTQLPLAGSLHTIGADDDVDLQITDWAMAPMVLEVDDEGAANIKPVEPATGTQPVGALASLEDFLPRRFGDVVLCIGPGDAEWPADVELMRRLMQPAAQPGAKAQRVTRLWVAGSAVLVLAVGISAGVVSHTRAAYSPSVVPPALLTQVQTAVTSLGLKGISVAAAGDKVVVQGLLAQADEAALLHRRLAAFPAERIEHRYAAATDVGISIADALGQSRLAVSYRGAGVFVVSGQARDLAKTRDAAARVANDLAPLVKGIEVAATAAPPTERLSVGAALASGGMQYVQTRDGAKHLSITQDPPQPTRSNP